MLEEYWNYWIRKEKENKIVVPLGMLFFIMLCTRRAKAMGVVACIFFVFLFVIKERKKLSRKKKICCGVVFIIAFVVRVYQLVSFC